VIFTVKHLAGLLNEIAARHGDGCLIGIDDADTDWEMPLEEFRFDEATKRVLLRAYYHHEKWPEETAADTEVK
jgi:hypothetical protein